MPFSPCVLRKDPKENVTTIDNAQYNSLLTNGTIGQGYDEEKILYLPEKQTDSPYGNESLHLREKIITIIQKLLRLDDESVQASSYPWMASSDVLNEAFNLIRTDNYIITQSAWAYLMKPNLKTQAEIDRIMYKTLPKDFNPASSFGLAVRASDKCSTGVSILAFITSSLYSHLTELSKGNGLSLLLGIYGISRRVVLE